MKTSEEILKDVTGIDLSKYGEYQNLVIDKSEFKVIIKEVQKETEEINRFASRDCIEQMKEDCHSDQEILEHLINNF